MTGTIFMQNATTSPTILTRIKAMLLWLRKGRVTRKLAFLLIIAAVISALATYITITRTNGPFGPDPNAVIGLVLINLVLLLSLMVIVLRRLVRLWVEVKQGSVGSRLQTRIVLIFSLVSAVPTVMVAIFSVLFFNFGIQSWFDSRVGTALQESVAVAEAYLKEHKNMISSDVWAMAAELNRRAFVGPVNNADFQRIISSEAKERYLTDAIVFRGNKIIAKASVGFSFAFERLPVDAIKQADAGKVVVMTNDDDDLVRALVKLDNLSDSYGINDSSTYLLIGRFVDSKVLEHVEKTKGAATEYQRMKHDISHIQVKFSIIFALVALLLLLAAAWLGMIFALSIARPIGRMIAATEKVKTGDLSARVKEGPKNDEIGTLARAFNRMTEQLERQRHELINANHQIDARRLFMETVLAGVSAGVVALDRHQRISLINRSASQLLAIDGNLENQLFASAFPEMADLLEEVEKRPDRPAQGQVEILRQGRQLTLLVRIASERTANALEGYVVTFDDMTELASAQRQAAWSDVARRIAHEIKNPLTPIQLAAERLKRKYADEVSDPKNFVKYTDTVMSHVEHIGKMVEEFSNFARIPSPVFADNDVKEILRNVIFSRECLEHGITYKPDLPDGKHMLYCDAGQLTQVFTNLLKNAEEAFEFYNTPEGEKPTISIALKVEGNHYDIVISDNGPGFPPELIQRLTEPYITTRAKGTGLGLAIVKKIVEDHAGRLILQNNSEGAHVTLTFLRKIA